MPDDLTKPVLDYGAYTLTPVTHDPFEDKEDPKYANLPTGPAPISGGNAAEVVK